LGDSLGGLPWAHLENSPTNIGGIGRFHLAKKIGKKRILFIDDDQIFGENLVADAHGQFRERTVKSWWAWKIRSSYFDRTRVKTGAADYCGTGGMLVDGDIFKINGCLGIHYVYEKIS
jgi:hypothetical protein